MRKIYFLFLLFFTAMQGIIDVESKIDAIKSAEFFPTDLPDSPQEEITRDVSTIMLSPGVTVQVSVPDVVCGATPFAVTATITNSNGTATAYSVTSLEGLIPNNVNVSFVSCSTNFGTCSSAGAVAGCPSPGGLGTWAIGSAIPAGFTATASFTCNTPIGASATVHTSSRIITTQPASICITNNFTIVPSPTADNYTNSISVCSGGALTDTLVATGGTPPYLFSLTVPPSHGTFTFNNPTTGSFTYVANPGFSGTDTFQFVVSDSNGCISNTALGTIHIAALPIAASGSFTTCTQTAVSGSLASFVSGGTPPYTYNITGSTNGTTVLTPAGSPHFTFTRANNSVTSGSFVYTVVDHDGCVASNTISIFYRVPAGTGTFVELYDLYYGITCTPAR